jgi:hypothetical protein
MSTNNTEEKLTPEGQKFLAKLTKNGTCRKIKCVEDMFSALCIPTVVNSEHIWIFKPTKFLYISQLRDIADNSRHCVQITLSRLLTLLKSDTLNTQNNDNDENNQKTQILNLITALYELVELLFTRDAKDKTKLKYFEECISILMTIGLDLSNYFYDEFKL